MLCFSEGQGAVEDVLPAWLTTHTELGSWLHQQKRVGAATGILPTSCMHLVWPARKPGGMFTRAGEVEKHVAFYALTHWLSSFHKCNRSTCAQEKNLYFTHV